MVQALLVVSAKSNNHDQKLLERNYPTFSEFYMDRNPEKCQTVDLDNTVDGTVGSETDGINVV